MPKRPKHRTAIGDKDQYLKAVKRANRLVEIELYGKVISTRPSIKFPNKKAYNRKRDSQRFTNFRSSEE